MSAGRFFSGIISESEVNTGRQHELDAAKALMILNLAIIHVYVECTTEQGLFYGLPYFFDSVSGGPFAAPIFMVCMGIGLVYTRKNSPKDLFKRGGAILGIGVLHNILRHLIPSLVGYGLTGIDRYMERLPFLFFSDDILQFAGLAMIFMALLKLCKLPPVAIWFLSLAMLFGAMPVNNIDMGSPVANILLGFFIGTEAKDYIVYTDFPLAIWFFMYASGMMFGLLLRRIKNKDRFYAIAAPPCLIFSWGVMLHEYFGGYGMMMGDGDNVFYHMVPLDAFACVLNAMVYFAAFHFIVKILPKRVMDGASQISRNINAAYFFQWVYVFWAVDVFAVLITGTWLIDPVPALFLGIALSILSVFSADVWMKFWRVRKKGQNEQKKENAGV